MLLNAREKKVILAGAAAMVTLIAMSALVAQREDENYRKWNHDWFSLGSLARYYLEYQQKHGTPPASTEDFAKEYGPMLDQEIGTGVYVIRWGTRIHEDRHAKRTVLAYSTMETSHGTVVLFCDGTKRTLRKRELASWLLLDQAK